MRRARSADARAAACRACIADATAAAGLAPQLPAVQLWWARLAEHDGRPAVPPILTLRPEQLAGR